MVSLPVGSDVDPHVKADEEDPKAQEKAGHESDGHFLEEARHEQAKSQAILRFSTRSHLHCKEEGHENEPTSSEYEAQVGVNCGGNQGLEGMH